MSPSKKQNKRPVLKLPLTYTEIGLEIISAIGVLLPVLVLIKLWTILPNTVPTHYGVSGKADAWGSKGSLLFLPVVVIFLYTLLTIVSRFPHIFNYPWAITEENAKGQYQLARTFLMGIKAEIVWSFAYVQWMDIKVAMGKAEGLGIAYLPILLLMIFGMIGIYIYRASRVR
ncbi:MAG: DUF1648 domain-containing protein [Thermoanaerobacteraceae bacterium]|nr:DUF1648 domain-containing protein [Thermoanaerobacteraceae bacterium]